MNLSLSNDLESFIESIPSYLKIIHGINFIICEITTFVCYTGFIHYEYYGGDPAKRSIKNKLWAQLCYTLLCLNITTTPMHAWRIFIGPINVKIIMIGLFITEGTTYFFQILWYYMVLILSCGIFFTRNN